MMPSVTGSTDRKLLGEDNRFCLGHAALEVQWDIQETCQRKSVNGSWRFGAVSNL